MVLYMNYFTIGKFFMALLFIVTGIIGLVSFSAFTTFVGKVLPFPFFFAIIAVAIQLVGGFALLFSHQMKISITILILFMVVTLLYHPITKEHLHFLKNLAIIGGLLILYSTTSSSSPNKLNISELNTSSSGWFSWLFKEKPLNC